ncbi:MAG: septal ring lytic transglycosylase RlpA family protein [Hyphomicrobiaceae bacterium]
MSAIIAGCARSSRPADLSYVMRAGPDRAANYSPRVVRHGRRVPRGGGRYKLGLPYTINGKRYYPKLEPNYDRAGIASWYGDLFHGRLTANGEVYDMNRLTAAHPTLPLPSLVKVTNRSNGRQLIVRVNDRGPYAHNRIIDLSRRSAELLGFKRQGTAQVRVQYYGPAPLNGDDRVERSFASRSRFQGRTAGYRHRGW